MTEDEAKAKWCPFGRAYTNSGSANRGSHSAVNESRCIASACMAWRWSEPYLLTESGRVMSVDWKANEPFQKVQPGYCGLAGKP